jgi:galactokinase
MAEGPGRRVRVWSDQFPEDRPVEYQLGEEAADRGWADYVRGMTMALAPLGLERGFDARIVSRVPLGSGLSSSASLEIALGRALRELYSLVITDVELARAGKRAENELVGAPVGIMDQMACSLADEAAALLLDTRDLRFERVPIPAGAALIVIHSGLSHRNVTGGYATRRRECAEAASLLEVRTLRDVDASHAEAVATLPEHLKRRVRHVLSENGRVEATAAALRAGYVKTAAQLFRESHASLRDDYEVSVPEIDTLVELTTRVQGIYGARLTGGGFGGSIVALADPARAGAAARTAADSYAQATGQSPRIMVPPEVLT